MKPIILALALLLAQSASAQTATADIRPAPYQSAWQDLEFGVILHFSTNTFLDREWGDGTAPPSTFNPSAFDPDQWMAAIAASGARYVVLVAKHHDGFCLWPTDQTTYSVKSSPWRNGHGDVVGDVARSARKFGLKFGVYLSPWDRHDPRYADSAAYDTYYNAELEELATRYGDLVEFWLDGAGSAGHVYNFPRIIETLRTYQPNTIVFADAALFDYGDARWVGNESGFVNYENWNVLDRHGYLRWRPVEADTPLRKNHWFWHPNDESSLKSLPELLETYDQTVGHGAQLMLGLAPDRRGLLPESDVARLRELGQALKTRRAANLALNNPALTNPALPNHPTLADPTQSPLLDGDPDTQWTAPTGATTANVELIFPTPITFDHALTMEGLATGQHIQRYSIDIFDPTTSRWTPITHGQAIGHTKIDSFPPTTASRIRLNILSTTPTPTLREFQLFHWSTH